MKTNFITTLLLIMYSAAFSQMQNITIENINFKVKSSFTLSNNHSKRIKLTDTIKTGNEEIIKTIYIKPNAIDSISTNHVKNISDILDLEKISLYDETWKEKKVEGTTELYGKKILFYEKVKEIYSNYKLIDLNGYEYSNIFYFFSSKNIISSIEYKVSINNREKKILKLNKVSKIISKNINLGDINDIIYSLEQ